MIQNLNSVFLRFFFLRLLGLLCQNIFSQGVEILQVPYKLKGSQATTGWEEKAE